ncbi:MAG: putative 2-aminoethylphosphonate transporter substrate-binding protein, partial [Rhodoferax sp.]|nr:putative 2-aminoethylphosphonate transporter substrate-binding protein [Rhodoferax sp.]
MNFWKPLLTGAIGLVCAVGAAQAQKTQLTVYTALETDQLKA